MEPVGEPQSGDRWGDLVAHDGQQEEHHGWKGWSNRGGR